MGTDNEQNAALMKKLKFRNYTPRTDDLRKYVEETIPADSELEKMVVEHRAALEEANAKFNDPSTDLENMAPKKVNWDLKAQLEPKLAVLRKQTQRALEDIVREKVTASGTGMQLASAVSNAPELSSEEDEEEPVD